ncbi:MAG: serine--tRNA ligase, partial [Ilumatobacter sp.]|nr:serine--tRNA ligase [Ilumatobacter sp.]
MIDVRLIRNDFDATRASLARRGDESVLVSLERARDLDARVREIVAERDALRAEVKSISKDVG